MRDQYAGDISDLLKIALLRHLAGNDLTLGVHWYYNADEENRVGDGRHLEYRNEEKWEALDSDLRKSLKTLPERKVTALEQLPVWPQGTVFFIERIPGNVERSNWVSRAKANFEEAKLLFLDPDNGMGERPTKKHATWEELRAISRPDRTLVIIKFPGRTNHCEQVRAYHARILSCPGFSSLLTLRISVRIGQVPRTRWFTIINGSTEIEKRANEYAEKIKAVKGCTVHISTGKECTEAAASLAKPVQTKGANSPKKICPACDHTFGGLGWCGIDSHWKNNHLSEMSYEEAWKLIKCGRYPVRQEKGSQE